jgi:hypothetical protein
VAIPPFSEGVRKFARSLLEDGAAKEAATLVAEEHVRIGTPGLGFKWKHGHPDPTVAAVLLQLGHESVEATPEQRRAISVELALHALIGEPVPPGALRRLLGGTFRCPPVEAAIADPPNGYVGTFRAEEACDLYALTMMAMVNAEASRREVLRVMAAGVGVVGVTVLTSGQPCRVCGVEPRTFPVGKVPMVPQHVGCRCVLQAKV